MRRGERERTSDRAWGSEREDKISIEAREKTDPVCDADATLCHGK